MPYAIIHLETAYQLLEHYTWIEHPADFILGSIVPDSVHFHADYQVREKEQSHLWNCGPRWGITTDSEGWKENVLRFWSEHRQEANRDYLAGYCVHILTDWLNDIRIWKAKDKGIEEAVLEEYHRKYNEEAHGIDQWLYHTSSNSQDIWELLKDSRIYSIAGRVQEEDVKRQRDTVLYEWYPMGQMPDVENYECCSKAVILNFINECVGEFPKLLTMP